MTCRTSSGYAKPTSAWPISPVAIAASIGVHVVVLGLFWLLPILQETTHIAPNPLEIALAPAAVSATQKKQHAVKPTKTTSAPARKKPLNEVAVKLRTEPKIIVGTLASSAPTEPLETLLNQESFKGSPKQAASEITPATPVRLTAQYAASNRKPTYPTLARRHGEQGTVILRIYVTVEGKADQAKVQQSSGYPLLDESAISAVRTWRFQPATVSGQPVAEWYQLAIPFKLID